MTLEGVLTRIEAACGRAGRDPSEVTLVVVTKEASVDQVRELVAAGCTDLGENRAQQLAERAELVPSTNWHFIGPLQTNKIRYLDGVHLLHGLTRPKEAAALQARGQKIGRSYDVLIEVNVAGEASKQGVDPREAEHLLAAVEAYPLVTPRGVMIVAPQVENHEDVRWVFAEARRLRDDLGFRDLSMGMTDDFEVAIEEGATIVRIGRAIFH